MTVAELPVRGPFLVVADNFPRQTAFSYCAGKRSTIPDGLSVPTVGKVTGIIPRFGAIAGWRENGSNGPGTRS